jgi:hypothetical protein
MRRSMLPFVLALLLSAAPAVSAEKQSWGFVRSGSEALLVYGVPESEAITLSFICEPKKKQIDVVTTVLPAKSKLGQAATIKLTNSSAGLDFKGKVGRDNADSGKHVSAMTAIDVRLFDLLENGTSVRIDVLSAHDSVPLKGIKAPLAQMRKACR